MSRKPLSRVPMRRFYGEPMSFHMRTLISDVVRANQELDKMGWEGRRVLGFKLPDWQRPERWTDDQCVNFIESIYLGANIGQFMANFTMKTKFDRILLDGQQRLHAIERYIADEFGVPGEDGVPVFWSELTEDDQAHLYRISFPALATEYTSDATLREAYNRHNFSGTAHLADERAKQGDFRAQTTRVPSSSSMVPLRRFYADGMNIQMFPLITGVSRGDRQLDETGWTGRRVMGFRLPEWQRSERWTDSQCVSFIESIYLGANIGQFMVNYTMNTEFDRILIDGQQRLHAIERYVGNEFAVPGEEGVPVFWSELTENERGHFYRIGFPSFATEYTNDATLREAYNRHNFSGSAHLASEKAESGDFRTAPPGFHGS